VKCNYCLKTFNGDIFKFKHHLVGTIYDYEPCALVLRLLHIFFYQTLCFPLDKIKSNFFVVLVNRRKKYGANYNINVVDTMKVVLDVKDASTKKRRLNKFEQIDNGEVSEQSFTINKMFKNKSSDGVQATLNQLYKEDDKEKVDA